MTLGSENKSCYSTANVMKIYMFTSILLEPKSYGSDMDGPR